MPLADHDPAATEYHLLDALDVLTGFVGNEEFRFHIPTAIDCIEAARRTLRTLEYRLADAQRNEARANDRLVQMKAVWPTPDLET